jgi:nucleotide-binding universal stress UspA family protein
MFKRILVPTDGSKLSERAIKKTIEFAKAISADVVGVTVSEPFHIFTLDPLMATNSEQPYQAACEKRAARYLGAIGRAAQAAGVNCTGHHVFSAQPYEAIIAAAIADQCDLIAMASHGRRGVSGLLLGSETSKVLTHSNVPVLVLR